jgi:ABC-type sulfate/molybdate transport systems ATPase subunit
MNRLECNLQLPLDTFELAVDLTIQTGVTVLLGPNGAGKSSLLLLLAGLLKPRAGRITLGHETLFDARAGIDLPPEQRRVGMVFQDLALFPHLDVMQNVVFGLRMRHTAKAAVRRRATEMLEQLEIAELAGRAVTTLSGGERQKVALARTLVTEPRLLLLDEPTTALDPAARGTVRRWLHGVLGELPIPTLLVTHDAEEVAWFRKRVAVIERGRIVQRGSYHQLLREPQSEFIGHFAGVNLIVGALVEKGKERYFLSSGGSRLQGRCSDALPGPATLAIAPWEVSLFAEPPGGSPQNLIAGRVSERVILGDRVRVTLLGKEKIVVEITHRAWQQMGEFDAGEKLYAVFKASDARIMNS